MPARISIKIGPHLPGVLEPGRLERAFATTFGRGVFEVAETGAAEVREQTPVGVSGILRASIGARVPMDTLVDFRVQGVIFSGAHAPYAEAVERGTRPHWAPIAPLKLWAQRVLGNERAAYAIQRSIARHGTRARKMFARVEALLPARLQARMQRAAADFVAALR